MVYMESFHYFFLIFSILGSFILGVVFNFISATCIIMLFIIQFIIRPQVNIIINYEPIIISLNC